MKIEEFRKTLELDKHSLDEELVQQPSLYFRISEAYVELAAIRDTKKEALETVDAKLDAGFRISNDKLTEPKIKNMIQAHTDHQEAFIAYNEAKKAADLMAGLKEAFHIRGYMLRDLVSLYSTGYYQADSVKDTASTRELTYNSTREKLAERRRA